MSDANLSRDTPVQDPLRPVSSRQGLPRRVPVPAPSTEHEVVGDLAGRDSAGRGGYPG